MNLNISFGRVSAITTIHEKQMKFPHDLRRIRGRHQKDIRLVLSSIIKPNRKIGDLLDHLLKSSLHLFRFKLEMRGLLRHDVRKDATWVCHGESFSFHVVYSFRHSFHTIRLARERRKGKGGGRGKRGKRRSGRSGKRSRGKRSRGKRGRREGGCIIWRIITNYLLLHSMLSIENARDLSIHEKRAL